MHFLDLFKAIIRPAAPMQSKTQAIRPAKTQLFIRGKGMIQVKDAATGKTLGFRSTVREARWFQRSIEANQQL